MCFPLPKFVVFLASVIAVVVVMVVAFHVVVFGVAFVVDSISFDAFVVVFIAVISSVLCLVVEVLVVGGSEFKTAFDILNLFNELLTFYLCRWHKNRNSNTRNIPNLMKHLVAIGT